MSSTTTLILGLETSCDETAAAVVRRDADGRGTLFSNQVRSQVKDHAPFGGVVPEIAARAHVEHLDGLIARAMAEAGASFSDLSAVASTAGPGLLGGLLVGMMEGKAIALAHDLPFLAINHLEGHALTPRLLEPCAFPYLLLLISGGHTQFQSVEGIGQYKRLGTTIDDALGEAFDKVAKLLGLAYPGGPEVEKAARRGNPTRFDFPRPLKGRADCNFSFSGLKTAVRECVQGLGLLTERDIADVCASFETAIADCMADRLKRAFATFREMHDVDHPILVVAGGVAANRKLRATFEAECEKHGFTLRVPPFHLCTDNAAMIAWAGAERLALGLTDELDFAAKPRWPLDTISAPVYGSGRLGAKA
ncbi:tRNA (adenosine(37)-N6)-threonylcarbamoyltransferase complex transferase subunit TsaD [Aestuariivirga litoralis]|uniref:tRNA (adenosine(37)-N6)-threonylcarbamoyltransferase complex transferase subunit TsaD n=1 Tax=Aestuariivirga litoralis TaxID=2650924 RepID=UPI0018C5D168|nr:tRNA (adenosine(37)-N6)-threonylcarbamoyltransferase complex transferase subunit TsaD [Aestuariivirga litoralis]MBG1232497.1 tRNA (adenosine(37)-N6)-threonylcarbamoyltransferase complex transferase subunit TsaD [Aestuariivirga litoralis]